MNRPRPPYLPHYPESERARIAADYVAAEQAWRREDQRLTHGALALLLVWNAIGLAAVIAAVWALIYVVPDFILITV